MTSQLNQGEELVGIGRLIIPANLVTNVGIDMT